MILRFAGEIRVTRFGSRRHRKLRIYLSIFMPNLKGRGATPPLEDATGENQRQPRIFIDHGLGDRS